MNDGIHCRDLLCYRILGAGQKHDLIDNQIFQNQQKQNKTLLKRCLVMMKKIQGLFIMNAETQRVFEMYTSVGRTQRECQRHLQRPLRGRQFSVSSASSCAALCVLPCQTYNTLFLCVSAFNNHTNYYYGYLLSVLFLLVLFCFL